MHAPATRELTDKQQAFIDHYLATGGVIGEAAKRAGYADPTAGSRLLQNPKVLNVLNQRMLDAYTSGAVIAQSTVMKLMQHAKSDYVKLEAAKTWLDRAGHKPPERVDHRVAADLTVSFDVSPVTKTVDVTRETEASPTEGGSENG